MGRGQGGERPQRKGFWDPRRLQYLLNVLKADLLGTMRNAFYHQKINFKKKTTPCFFQTKVAASVHLTVYYNQKKGVSISDLEESEAPRGRQH